MTSAKLYKSFCNFIDAQIFPDENIGTPVSFVVDNAFISDFCKKNEITEKQLLNVVRDHLYSPSRDIKHIKGILAIQLYAASKRANSEGITVKNYRDRLSQVLDWDINDLQRWMEENQEFFWESFYSWCDNHYFIVSKCQRKYGAGRYVQYPLMQSLCVFTEEDLKYIACAFVNVNLQPGEDISEDDFWRTISKYRIKKYFYTNHSKEVLENSVSEEDYLRQIFNFYLKWDGEYKDKYDDKIKKLKVANEDEFLYLNTELFQLQFRDSKLSLLKQFEIENLKYKDITPIFNFKHKGLILFKKDDVYEGYWQETRYLEFGEEGIALIFYGYCHHGISIKTDLLIKRYAHIALYYVKESLSTHDLYTQKRFYSLQGGLKIDRLRYLYGAGPMLMLTQKCKYWIDGKLKENTISEEKINLFDLDVGNHTIRFPNFKKIEFEIVEPTVKPPNWLKNYNKWWLDIATKQWSSERLVEGIVGLDFSIFPQNIEPITKESVLKRWSRIHLFDSTQNNEKNIAIKILSNIKKYHGRF